MTRSSASSRRRANIEAVERRIQRWQKIRKEIELQPASETNNRRLWAIDTLLNLLQADLEYLNR